MKLTRNKPLLAVVSLGLVAFLGWLAFGFFGVQAAFLDEEVSEAGPAFDSGAQTQDEVVETDEFKEAMEEAEADSSTANEEPMPGDITTLVSGDFAGNSDYTISGSAQVLNDGSEQRFLRFENFEASNGPDLNVYLRASNGDFVDLGDLKGNIGDQNYEIPADVELETFNTVEIWCVRFGVGFGQAALA